VTTHVSRSGLTPELPRVINVAPAATPDLVLMQDLWPASEEKRNERHREAPPAIRTAPVRSESHVSWPQETHSMTDVLDA